MKQKAWCCHAAAVLCILAFFLTGCGQEEGPKTVRQTRREFLVPVSSREEVYASGPVSLDASPAADGYIQVCYSGDAPRAKAQITIPDGTVYTYNLTSGNNDTLPLTGGSGTYLVDILENAYDNFYALVFSRQLQVEIADEFGPFLYPNKYVWYTPESQVCSFGIELSDKSSDDMDYVERVYDYVTSHITYDKELAQTVKTGYVPDVDHTLECKTGICFDYASLMAAMLRSQGIPTKLVFGYSGSAYHAWIDVYLEQEGWVSKVIYFDGHSWSLMDPTLGASNFRDSVKEYVGDGSHYLVKYQY